MPQSYKIYIKDVPLILTSISEKFNKSEYAVTDMRIIQQLDKISTDAPHLKNLKGLLWPVADADAIMLQLKTQLRLVRAAGGIVWNRKNQLLMIFRRGRWDLPKGKIENDETVETASLREVEEESGVGKLRLLHLFEKSYHIYLEDGLWTLKETYWYEMVSHDEGTPTPQISEGITLVDWANIADINERMKITYPNVRDLVTEALRKGYTSYQK